MSQGQHDTFLWTVLYKDTEVFVVLELGKSLRLVNELQPDDLREEVRGLLHILGEHDYVLQCSLSQF